MSRLLVIGGNGQVGRELRRSLAALGEVIATTRDGRLHDGSSGIAVDVGDLECLAQVVRDVAPDAVINAAAYTAVDKAETDAEAAFRINGEAPGVLARACAAAGIPLVHYSTDYVFDGQGSRPYREDDPTAPLGVYGASKLAGEQAIAAAGGQHLVFRTAWVYAHHSHNFLRTMLRVGAEREELRVVADQIGTPTPAALIADVTTVALGKALDDRAVSGTWHLVAQGQTSWHGFAEAIFEESVEAGLLPRAPRVLPIATAEYPTPARRPAYSCLDTAALHRDFQIDLPPWRQALGQVMQTLVAAEAR